MYHLNVRYYSVGDRRAAAWTPPPRRLMSRRYPSPPRPGAAETGHSRQRRTLGAASGLAPIAQRSGRCAPWVPVARVDASLRPEWMWLAHPVLAPVTQAWFPVANAPAASPFFPRHTPADGRYLAH